MNDSIQNHTRLLPRISAGLLTVIATLFILAIAGSLADTLHIPSNDFTTTLFTGLLLAAGATLYRITLHRIGG